MTSPNTLSFVDFPSPDAAASGAFYAEVFGWEVEPRPADVFYRIVPGGHFPPRDLSTAGRAARTWILVADDDSEDRILDTAATELWRHHDWAELNGFNGAFVDPWGDTFVLWTKGGDDPELPAGCSGE